MYSSNRANYSSLNQPYPMDDETESIYGIRLTPAVYYELIEYFNLNENLGLRQSDVIAKLLKAFKELSIIRNQQRIESSIPPPPLKRHLPVPPTAAIASLAPHGLADPNTGRRIVTFGHDTESEGDDDDEVGASEEVTFYGDRFILEEEQQPNQSRLSLANARPMVPFSRNISANTVTSTSSNNRATTKRSDARKRSVDKAIKWFKPSRGIPAYLRNQSDTNPKPQRQRTVEPRDRMEKEHRWSSYCRRFLIDYVIKWRRDDLLHCRKCDRWLKIPPNCVSQRCYSLLNHVCSHIGKPIMYACQLCGHKTAAQISMRKHLNRVHKRSNDFDDLTDTHFDEIAQMIKDCFDYTDIGEPPSGVKRLLTSRSQCSLRKSLLTQARPIDQLNVRQFIFRIVEKWQLENKIYCRHCSRWLRLENQPWKQTQTVLTHVCNYFDIKIYRCLICDRRTATNDLMAKHTRDIHQTTSRGNCVEESDKYEANLKDLIKEYFDWEEGTGPPELSAIGPLPKRSRSGQKMMKKMKCQKKKKTMGKEKSYYIGRWEALKYGYYLLQQYQEQETMDCQVCDSIVNVQHKGIRGPYGRPASLLEHVLTHHIKECVYECRTCEKTTRGKAYMRQHMAVDHKNTKSDDFIDKTNEMKDEILDMMEKCFDLLSQPVEEVTSGINVFID